jgi:hypothetical protein
VGLRIRHNFSRLVSLSKHLGESVLTESAGVPSLASTPSINDESPWFGGGPRGILSFSSLGDSRPELESSVAGSALGQLTGLSDPPPVLSQLPFGHGSKRYKIDMRPRSEGDEKRRHAMGDFHTAHARLFSLPGWSSHNRCRFRVSGETDLIQSIQAAAFS